MCTYLCLPTLRKAQIAKGTSRRHVLTALNHSMGTRAVSADHCRLLSKGMKTWTPELWSASSLFLRAGLKQGRACPQPGECPCSSLEGGAQGRRGVSSNWDDGKGLVKQPFLGVSPWARQKDKKVPCKGKISDRCFGTIDYFRLLTPRNLGCWMGFLFLFNIRSWCFDDKFQWVITLSPGQCCVHRKVSTWFIAVSVQND